jgi:hypothetical protein
LRSLTAVGLVSRGCSLLRVTRRAAGGWSWWRGWPRGGAFGMALAGTWHTMSRGGTGVAALCL